MLQNAQYAAHLPSHIPHVIASPSKHAGIDRLSRLQRPVEEDVLI